MGRGRELLIVVALVAVLAWWLRPAPEPNPVATPTPLATPVASKSPEAPPDSGTLEPFPGAGAPRLTQKVLVHFDTTGGPLELAVFPQAAPLTAANFLRLVNKGFYDNTPLLRVVPDFVTQFGINSRFASEETATVADEPSLFKLKPGVMAVAKASTPDSASTQMFFCHEDLSESLVPAPGTKGVGIFTAFARVTRGDYKHFKATGDSSMGLDQGALWADTAGYLKTLPEQPDMILKAYVVKN